MSQSDERPPNEDSKDATDGRPPSATTKSDAAKPWLDRASTHHRIFYTLLVVCALLVASDLVYHKHAHFDYELWFGFYAGFGFLAYCSIVFSAKLLRRIVKREEDYYD